MMPGDNYDPVLALVALGEASGAEFERLLIAALRGSGVDARLRIAFYNQHGQLPEPAAVEAALQRLVPPLLPGCAALAWVPRPPRSRRARRRR